MSHCPTTYRRRGLGAVVSVRKFRDRRPRRKDPAHRGPAVWRCDDRNRAAGWKQYYSLYPANARLIAAFKDDLAPYEFNSKGAIRFPLSEPVPVKLIERIAKFRANEIAELKKAKAAAPKKR